MKRKDRNWSQPGPAQVGPPLLSHSSHMAADCNFRLWLVLSDVFTASR